MKDATVDDRNRAQQNLWKLPIDLAQYDRDTILSQQEYEILDGKLASPPYRLSKSYREMLHRLVQPVEDALQIIQVVILPNMRFEAIRVLCLEMHLSRPMDWGLMELFGEALEKRASLGYTFRRNYAERLQGNAYHLFTAITRWA
jgi:hypothetical protein